MREMLLSEYGKLKSIDTPVEGCWINITSPDSEDISFLKEMGVEEDFVYDSLDQEERARFEQDEDLVYIITKLPYFDGEDKAVPYKTMTLGIAMKSGYFVTISGFKSAILEDLIEGRVRDVSTKKRNRLLLRIFDRGTVYYLRYLKEIRRLSNEIESELHRSTRNKELVAMLNLEKSLVFFTTSLRSNELMYEKLKRAHILTLYEEDEELFEDISIENRQAIEMANIYSDILTGMMDAFASVISNNLNVVMKILTIVTLALQIPTLVASIYGMNVALPFMDSPSIFYWSMGLSGLAAVIVGFILFKIRWFK
ncbi:MAG: magnesium transporter CorA family protein [Mesotoga sp.]|uniref:Mg2 transporter protein CorA family protein n=2 Tax=Mesotoga infera TaxID=1236046 RepID=A0A7Z7LGG5_9BACT|nr:magnesium transporter CorA family protein [Mesotoga sp.]NLI05859.1 magnesium transporter CorA family protein [Thermotogaceae bacterium]SSC13017.1 Mg2 transporter protein CorA family protein [Mesotoga infera]